MSPRGSEGLSALGGGETELRAPSKPAFPRVLSIVNGVFPRYSDEVGLPWRAWVEPDCPLRTVPSYPWGEAVALRQWTSLISTHYCETMGMALSIPHWASVPLLTLELLFRSANSKALETEGHCVWLWVVLGAAHSQDDCDPLLPRGAALLRASQGGPWFLSPAQPTHQAKDWSSREPSQSKSASYPSFCVAGTNFSGGEAA